MTNLVPECDAPDPKPVYSDGRGGYICRCVVCARCKHHTGNSNQGHYWSACKVLMKNHKNPKSISAFINSIIVEFHHCCPDDCALYNQDGTKK